MDINRDFDALKCPKTATISTDCSTQPLEALTRRQDLHLREKIIHFDYERIDAYVPVGRCDVVCDGAETVSDPGHLRTTRHATARLAVVLRLGQRITKIFDWIGVEPADQPAARSAANARATSLDTVSKRAGWITTRTKDSRLTV